MRPMANVKMTIKHTVQRDLSFRFLYGLNSVLSERMNMLGDDDESFSFAILAT
jgi:hypothetical protein